MHDVGVIWANNSCRLGEVSHSGKFTLKKLTNYDKIMEVIKTRRFLKTQRIDIFEEIFRHRRRRKLEYPLIFGLLTTNYGTKFAEKSSARSFQIAPKTCV